MPETNAPIPWQHVFKTLVLYAPMWVGATILFTAIGVITALVSTDHYAASMPVVLRDEATGSVERLGRFGSQSQLKAAQETILEMARNQEVVREALLAVGPESGKAGPDWPSIKQVEQVADEHINVRAPQGGEFGNSEVIYLQVEATSRKRAEAFCRAVFDSLAQRMRSVRRIRADSVLDELVQARKLAEQKLGESMQQLKHIEIDFGSDLGELRNLSETVGDVTIRRALDQTNRELQAAQLELDSLKSLLQLLEEGRRDPKRLIVAGGDLLSSQPSLLKLKDGLIRAQLLTSELNGRYQSGHPELRAAEETEAQIRHQLQLEAGSVIQAMQPNMRLKRQKIANLNEKKQQLVRRLERVAQVRSEYAALLSEVKYRTRIVETTDEALTEAQASRAAALSVNLLAELGPPIVGEDPVGTSGTLLTLGASTAGLMFGLGGVFLIAPGPDQRRRGRRWSDAFGGRRASDRVAAVATPAATPGTSNPAAYGVGAVPGTTPAPATTVPTTTPPTQASVPAAHAPATPQVDPQPEVVDEATPPATSPTPTGPTPTGPTATAPTAPPASPQPDGRSTPQETPILQSLQVPMPPQSDFFQPASSASTAPSTKTSPSTHASSTQGAASSPADRTAMPDFDQLAQQIGLDPSKSSAHRS